jgi:hypothetical protein
MSTRNTGERQPVQQQQQAAQPATSGAAAGFGAIGISAVAAAATFKPETKNPLAVHSSTKVEGDPVSAKLASLTPED